MATPAISDDYITVFVTKMNRCSFIRYDTNPVITADSCISVHRMVEVVDHYDRIEI